MIDTEQKIPCPVCQTAIPFNTKQLLLGVTFSCPQCSAAVGLATESKQTVQHAMDRLDLLKAGKSFSKI